MSKASGALFKTGSINKREGGKGYTNSGGC